MSKHKISGQFVPRLIEMLRSPAFRALSLTGHRILARIEIELASHGGRDNGKLPVTFADFEQYGIERHAVGRGIRAVCALGLVELTRRGRSGGGEYRTPNLFRITYLPAYGKTPTHEWRRIKTVEQAEKIAREFRRPIKKQRWGKATGKGGENPPATSAQKATVDPVSEVGKSHHYLDRDLAISPSGPSQQGHSLSGQPPSGTTPRRPRVPGAPITFHRPNKRRNSHVKN